jgi:RimJ/RimL family protein N-acetyltransferase
MRFRPATLDDASLLLEWRNDPLTRRMSINGDLVDRETHIAWLTRRLGQAEPHLYIAELHGEPFGTFRIDGDEISYTIAPGFRGRGLATRMLAMALESFGPKRARVRADNAASARAAREAGHIVEIIRSP